MYSNFLRDGFTIFSILLRPKSRGIIQLKSKKPFDKPVIKPNYYSDANDIAIMKAGLKIAFNMTLTETFQKKKLMLMHDKFSCGDFKPPSDDYFDCLLRHWTHTIYHPVGTCKMGPSSDPYSVVDAQLKVYGMKNLRVIDASIMPTIVGGNTYAASIMIGEKGAHMVKAQWSQSRENVNNKKNNEKDEL